MFERYISRVIPPNLGSPDEEEAEATQQEHKGSASQFLHFCSINEKISIYYNYKLKITKKADYPHSAPQKKQYLH